jgi:hypothetical protein
MFGRRTIIMQSLHPVPHNLSPSVITTTQTLTVPLLLGCAGKLISISGTTVVDVHGINTFAAVARPSTHLAVSTPALEAHWQALQLAPALGQQDTHEHSLCQLNRRQQQVMIRRRYDDNNAVGVMLTS